MLSCPALVAQKSLWDFTAEALCCLELGQGQNKLKSCLLVPSDSHGLELLSWSLNTGTEEQLTWQ